MKKRKKQTSQVRCQKNKVKRQKRFVLRLMRQMGKRCKYVYNSGLYCWKNWYTLFKIQCKYYIDNLEEYNDKLSPSDRLVLGKYCKTNGNLEKLNVLIKNSHISESELKTLSSDDIVQELLIEEKLR